MRWDSPGYLFHWGKVGLGIADYRGGEGHILGEISEVI